MKTIGLTGGIGSGKTTVAEMLEQLGATVINADAVGHDVYRPGTEGWRQVTAAFGNQILQPDQTIDRKKLGSLVFGNPQELARLNAIVHPLIRVEVERRIASLGSGGSTQTVVVEAAILIEANWVTLVDEVWLVTASKQMAVTRVATQRGLSAHEVATRVDAQLTDAERRHFAHVVIDNTGSMDDLRSQVHAAWARSVGPGPRAHRA